MRLALLLICAFTSIARADQQDAYECLTLPTGRVADVAGDTLYALHDNGFGTNDLFVIALGPEPKLIARLAFMFKPSVLYVDGSRVRVAGYDQKYVTRLVDLDVTATPRLVGKGIACALPKTEYITSAPDIRATTWKGGNVIEVQRSAKFTRFIDHTSLVTANHWEFIRWLGPHTCEREIYLCSKANLDSKIRSNPFELVHVKDGIIYSVSYAGIAAHKVDTLALAGSLRWPTLQAQFSTLIKS